jgi:hypothetical protein
MSNLSSLSRAYVRPFSWKVSVTSSASSLSRAYVRPFSQKVSVTSSASSLSRAYVRPFSQKVSVTSSASSLSRAYVRPYSGNSPLPPPLPPGLELMADLLFLRRRWPSSRWWIPSGNGSSRTMVWAARLRPGRTLSAPTPSFLREPARHCHLTFENGEHVGYNCLYDRSLSVPFVRMVLFAVSLRTLVQASYPDCFVL